MLPLWTPHRNSSFAAFMLLLGLVWVTPSYAALTRPNVEIDPVLPNIPFPVDAPTLSGSQFTSIVELRWSINCSVTAVNIQESVDNQSWTTVYTGLGQADSGAAAYATFAVGGDVCSGGWSSKRLLQLPNKTLPGYYYRINACIGSSCSAYNLPISVGTPSAPSAPSAPASISTPATNTAGAFSVSWAGASGATRYELQQRINGGAWIAQYSGAATSYALSGLTSGTYQYQVRACTTACSAWMLSSNTQVALPVTGSDWSNLSPVTVADAGGSDRAPSEAIDFRASAVNGLASVSGGAAVFSVPIDIPPGRNGMQPAVSLDYSSRSGQGIAGVGWSVTAGSALHRCDTTVAQEGLSRAVIMSASDRLCLDGQKLMAVSGQYGTSGAQYRTELDQFARVTQYGALTSATSYFVVERKDNIVATYGGTTDSRHIALGHTLPMTWAINKQQDRAGNTMTYAYLNAGSGEYALSAIDYTGHQSSVGNRKVAFQYETRPDQTRHYLAGGLIRSTLRLKAIESQLDNIPLRRYELVYDTSSHTQRSLLQSIKECYQGQCKAATDLRSYAPLLAWDSRDSSSSAHRVISPVAGNGRYDRTTQMDLNGDGIQELIHFSAQHDGTDKLISYLVKIYQRQASGDYTLAYDASAQSSDIANGIFYYPQGDLNGDGISDFFIVNHTSGQVSLFQFNQDLVPQPLIPTNVILPSDFWTNPSGVGATLQIVDLNGDGHQDFAYIGADHKVYYYQHQGGVTPSFSGPHLLTTRSKTTYEGKSYLEQIRFMDMDGDGVMDVVKTLRLANASEQISVQFGSISSNGLLTLGTAVSSATLGLPTNHVNNEYVFADLNGDGLADYIRALQVGSSFSWQVRENRGNRTFAPERSLGTGTGIHAYQNGTTRIQSRWGSLQVADIDSDGVDELLVATHSLDNVCVGFSGNPNSSGSQEPYDVTVCNDDLHRSDVNLSSHPWLTINIDWSRYDARRFH